MAGRSRSTNGSNIKWLIAGLAGASFSILLCGTAVFLAVKYASKITVQNGKVVLVATKEIPPDIRDKWADNQWNYTEAERRHAAESERLGLQARYRTVRLHGDTRDKLYLDRNFALVEGRLSAQLSACTTPMAYYRYGQHIEYLADFTAADSPIQMMSVLDEWVRSRPDSYQAWLVRGAFGHQYYWLVQRFSLSELSVAEGWRDAHSMREQSRADLNRAWELSNSDPEIPAWRMKVNARSRDGGDGVERYYKDTIALCPFHFEAREGKVHYAQPEYGGSEDAMDEIVAEAIKASEDFPLLMLIPRYAKWVRTESRELSDEAWVIKQGYTESLAAYEAQLEETPDDVHLMASAAFFAIQANRPDRAAHWFGRIGEVFPAGGEFFNIVEFDRVRREALGLHSTDTTASDGVKGQ